MKNELSTDDDDCEGGVIGCGGLLTVFLHSQVHYDNNSIVNSRE